MVRGDYEAVRQRSMLGQWLASSQHHQAYRFDGIDDGSIMLRQAIIIMSASVRAKSACSLPYNGINH
jgi:hypothetical protein